MSSSFYVLYLPYLVMRKGLELGLKVLLIIAIVFVLVELKWLVQDQVFDRQDIDSYLEKAHVVGKKVANQGAINAQIMLSSLRESELWKAITDKEP